MKRSRLFLHAAILLLVPPQTLRLDARALIESQRTKWPLLLITQSTVLDDAGDLFNLGPPSLHTHNALEGREGSSPLPPPCSLGALREAASAAAVDLGGLPLSTSAPRGEGVQQEENPS